MNLNSLLGLVLRVLFAAAFLLFCLAVAEAVAYTRGYTFLKTFLLGGYTPGRLLEISASIAVFVVILLLRQIRDELRRRGPA